MTQHDRLRAANPVPQHEVDALPLDGADAMLLEEIMTAPEPTTARRWFPAVAAAAAVAVIGVGAVWLGTGPGTDPSPASTPGVANTPGLESPVPPEQEASRDVVCVEGEWFIEAEEGEAVSYECAVASSGPDPDPDTDSDSQPRYQRPPRPYLLTADGWRIESVDGTTVSWVGPEGQELYADWLVTANPQDPFAYDRYDRPGEAIELDGLTVRITGFSERGDEYQVAVTEAVPEQRLDDDASLVLETRDLGPAEFRSVVESLRFVSLEAFERAAGR